LKTIECSMKKYDDVMNMSGSECLLEQLRKLRLVPVVTLPSVQAALKLSEILLRCNLPVVEITLRTSCAVEGMAAIKKEHPELLVLAGTVLTPQQADMVVEAGAAAIVSPGFSQRLAKHCIENDVLFFPGVCTPTEVQMAMDAGFRSLKFFPAERSGGYKTVSLFKALYQDVFFIPTGGINLDNLVNYLLLENVLCCGGTWLSPEQFMAEERWDEIEEQVKAAANAVVYLRP